MIKIIFVFTGLLVSLASGSQAYKSSLNYRYSGFCTYSSIHADAFSFLNNQAALLPVKNFSAGITSDRRFFLNELSEYQAVVVVPASAGMFGWNGTYFGNMDFHEFSSGLAYAKNMGKTDIGIQFSYHHLQSKGYTALTSVLAEAGVIFQVNEKLRLGIHVFQPKALKKTQWPQGLTETYSMGFGFDASPHFYMGVTMEKTGNNGINVQAGIHYEFAENIFARAGISSATQVYYAGIGFRLRRFRLDVMTSLHPYLGITPGLMLQYFKKEQQ